MKKYTDKEGRNIIEVDDLTFIGDRDYPYNWFQRHFHHHRLRLSLKKADLVVAADTRVAVDLVRYYFVPKERMLIRDQEQLND